jgi:hypothetical protein
MGETFIGLQANELLTRRFDSEILRHPARVQKNIRNRSLNFGVRKVPQNGGLSHIPVNLLEYQILTRMY